MSDIFLRYSIGQLITKLQQGELTAVELVQVCLNNIKALDKRYHAFVVYDEMLAVAQAQEVVLSTKKFSAGLLAGIPIGVKDVFNTRDFSTQMGSPLWKGFTPGNDARAVFNLKRQGAIIPGKTVTAEFAVHALNETINPHHPALTPGTSSSGSAAAVALGMVPAAIGTQTAGSIIRPASFCGIWGCRPSFGLIPRTGSLKTTDTLDAIGYFVSQAVDLRRLFDSLRVVGLNYPLSHAALSDESRQNKPVDRPWRVAFVKTHVWPDAYDYAQAALIDFGKKLAEFKEVALREIEPPAIMKTAHHIHGLIYNKTLSYYFKKEFAKAELVSAVMNDLIKEGLKITTAEYLQALAEQVKISQAMDQFFADYDIIISLSTAGEAPPRNVFERPDPALVWTLANLPAVSAPAFISPAGQPFGLQLVARRYNDYLLFNFIDWLLANNLVPAGANPLLTNL